MIKNDLRNSLAQISARLIENGKIEINDIKSKTQKRLVTKIINDNNAEGE